jgi:hypothetical protein
MVKSGVSLILAACFLLPACGDDGDDEPEGDEHIEIAGEWAGNFDGTHLIADDSWESTYDPYVSVAEIVEFSNDDNDAILLSEDGTYGRNVWTEIDDGSFFYCSVSFGKASADEAISESQLFDDGDPENVGCGDMDAPWSMLTRR